MFATTKRWWTTIGGMDTDLSTWGGENIEISLRTWLCGGEIRVARGSRIDHAFRTKFPYTVDGGLYRRNLVRIAEAWMDLKSRQKFYKASGILPGSVPFGSIDEQLATQKRLKCKPFAWYLKKFANRSPIDKTP
jgi:polypeptide N-acetylgalactosaminyltransferase